MLRLPLTLVLLSTACATVRSPPPVAPAPAPTAPAARPVIVALPPQPAPVPTAPVEGPVIPGLVPVLRPLTSGKAWVDLARGVVFALDANQVLVAFDGHTGKERFRVADFSNSNATIGATGPFLYSAVSSHGGKVRVVFVESASGHAKTCELALRVPPRANALSVLARATASGIQLVWNASDLVSGGPRREADPAASECGELPFDPSTCTLGELSATRSGPYPCMNFVDARAPGWPVPVDALGGVKLKVSSKLEGPANCGGFTRYFLSGVSTRVLWRRELAGEPTFCPIP